MLRDIAWREVKKGWEADAQERSKLKVLQGLLASGGKARCMDVIMLSITIIALFISVYGFTELHFIAVPASSSIW